MAVTLKKLGLWMIGILNPARRIYWKIPGKIRDENHRNGWSKIVRFDNGTELALMSLHKDSHYAGGYFRPIVIITCYFQDYMPEIEEIANAYRLSGYTVQILESQKLYLRQVLKHQTE